MGVQVTMRLRISKESKETKEPTDSLLTRSKAALKTERRRDGTPKQVTKNHSLHTPLNPV